MLPVVARGGRIGKLERHAWISAGVRAIAPGAGEGGVRPVFPAAKGPARLKRSSTGNCSRRQSAFPRHLFLDRARHWLGRCRRHRHLPPLSRRRVGFRSRRSFSFLPERRMARHRWALAIAPRRRSWADRPLSIRAFRQVLAKGLAPAGDRVMAPMTGWCSRARNQMRNRKAAVLTNPRQTTFHRRTPTASSTPMHFAGACRERKIFRQRRKRLQSFQIQ
jgi:hypothetical protein